MHAVSCSCYLTWCARHSQGYPRHLRDTVLHTLDELHLHSEILCSIPSVSSSSSLKYCARYTLRALLLLSEILCSIPSVSSSSSLKYCARYHPCAHPPLSHTLLGKHLVHFLLPVLWFPLTFSRSSPSPQANEPHPLSVSPLPPIYATS